MANLAQQEVGFAEERHRVALRLAAFVAELPRDEQLATVLAYTRIATIVRDSYKETARVVKAQTRVARRRGRTKDDQAALVEQWIDIAYGSAARAAASVLGVDLDVAVKDKRVLTCVKYGMDEVGEMAAAMPSDLQGNAALPELFALSASVSAICQALAFRRREAGVQLPGFLGAICQLSPGKLNGPQHMAALALAELGFSNAEIHRALAEDRRKTDDTALKSRAFIRRMTRDARSN